MKEIKKTFIALYNKTTDEFGWIHEEDNHFTVQPETRGDLSYFESIPNYIHEWNGFEPYKIYLEGRPQFITTLNTRIADADMTVRLYNLIKNYYWRYLPDAIWLHQTLEDVKNIDIKKMRQMRGFGNKTEVELKELLRGLT